MICTFCVSESRSESREFKKECVCFAAVSAAEAYPGNI